MPHPFVDRIALLGSPTRVDPGWTPANLGDLRDKGFTHVQLNIAWGRRPDDEALNLEDAVAVPPALAAAYPPRGPIPQRAKAERLVERADAIRTRAAAAHRAGLRTVFHAGVPGLGMYAVPMAQWSGPLARCISDPATHRYYAGLLAAFADAHPEVDDLLIYTYDQDAWICSEFGTCPACRGVPLHRRLPQFVQHIARTWRSHRAGARTWWEPWELSAGQVHACVAELDPTSGIALALHSNIAEVQATLAVDRWLRNTCALARRRGLHVTVEHWLGAGSEEVEPLAHLSHPQLTWRALQRIAALPGVGGIKEYFGLQPDRPDPNLAATALFLAEPDLDEATAMLRVAAQFSADPAALVAFWTACADGMEAFPWDASWWIRQLGKARPDHAMSAAIVRGFCADSPSWRSTRGAVFMRIDNLPTHPWLLEDIELRCRQAAAHWAQAFTLAPALTPHLSATWQEGFALGLKDLDHCRRMALGYAHHCRLTNLAELLRATPDNRLLAELASELAASAANAPGEEIKRAQADLAADPQHFLATWLLPATSGSGRGVYSVTSA